MLDLRVPSGWFFFVMGVMLTAVGVFSDYSAPLTPVNVNLYTGIAMLIFGGVLLWLSRRTTSSRNIPNDSPAIENRPSSGRPGA